MASYELFLTESAQKDLNRISRVDLKRIDSKLIKLQENPFLLDVKKLSGSKNNYRVRVGDYRVLFSLESHRLIVYAVAHRREVYR